MKFSKAKFHSKYFGLSWVKAVIISKFHSLNFLVPFKSNTVITCVSASPRFSPFVGSLKNANDFLASCLSQFKKKIWSKSLWKAHCWLIRARAESGGIRGATSLPGRPLSRANYSLHFKHSKEASTETADSFWPRAFQATNNSSFFHSKGYISFILNSPDSWAQHTTPWISPTSPSLMPLTSRRQLSEK